jgi:hypothetical protein
MKIEGPRATGASGTTRKSGGAAAPGFAVPTGATSAPASAAGVAATMSVDALVALQGYSDPGRRGRQAKRGRATLDALESLMRATLSGEAPHAARLTLVKLQSEIELTGDPGLDSVLAEIDLRAAVELAKLDMADASRA